MINIILDLLPETVDIGGVEYPINTDFRTSILFELMMQDTSLSNSEKIRKAVKLYYPQKPHDISGAVDELLWFYRCGRDEGTTKSSDDEDEEESPQRLIYSFEHDAEYIYAAYLGQYGIDLQDVEDLHWWKFRAMFKSLEESCEFVKIMGYRSIKVTSKMSKEQQSFYRKMQRIHALPIPDDEQEKYDAITYALMHGGDLTGLL